MEPGECYKFRMNLNLPPSHIKYQHFRQIFTFSDLLFIKYNYQDWI